MSRGDNLRSYYYRFTVEDSITLTLGQLETIKSRKFRKFALSKVMGDFAKNTLEFYQAGELKGKVFSVLSKEDNGLKLILGYKCNDLETEQHIHLSYVLLNYGGLRFYLHCPSCGRRGDKLYLVPNRNRFMCRNCGNLTYQSCKKSEGITNFERIVASMGNFSIYEAKYFSNSLAKAGRESLKTYIYEKPYNEELPMHATTLKFGKRQMRELNELSKKTDLPKSELIRRAVDKYLEAEVERELKEKQLANIKINL